MNPLDWSKQAAHALAIGLDLGFVQDHSFMTAGGIWMVGGRPTIGVFKIKQFELGCPHDEVASEVASYAKSIRAKIMCDLSNNGAFASILAAHFQNPMDAIVGASITNAYEHAGQPVPFRLSVGGVNSVIPKWGVSKQQLMQELSAEVNGGTLVPAREGDWQILNEEMSSLQQEFRASGRMGVEAPQGKHDDGPMSLALLIFTLRRIGGMAHRRTTPKRAGFGAKAWT